MDFMNQNPQIPTEIYGRWSKVVAEELMQEGYIPSEARTDSKENQKEDTNSDEYSDLSGDESNVENRMDTLVMNQERREDDEKREVNENKELSKEQESKSETEPEKRKQGRPPKAKGLGTKTKPTKKKHK